ncbi:hypothetical protein K469DRAFT_745708 [Zopfia rhizophila CBS 207.26]|uniref:C2H2-type domain-containing protein n=1 Tax=Zopfia rhizophila CBS 207.26 TaxID=1314779 RepID=A0A6A6EQM8_9PEZI|nr:hypothetical protein K469DRAFT_745708 [Zopfia rhizophila CBS 207.26]
MSGHNHHLAIGAWAIGRSDPAQNINESELWFHNMLTSSESNLNYLIPSTNASPLWLSAEPAAALYHVNGFDTLLPPQSTHLSLPAFTPYNGDSVNTKQGRVFSTKDSFEAFGNSFVSEINLEQKEHLSENVENTQLNNLGRSYLYESPFYHPVSNVENATAPLNVPEPIGSYPLSFHMSENNEENVQSSTLTLRDEATTAFEPVGQFNENPYSCTYCHEPFACTTKLRQHVFKHTLPHKCPHISCNSAFAYRKDLVRHLNTRKHRNNVAVDGPQSNLMFCEVRWCKRSKEGFARRDHYVRHVRKMHPGLGVDEEDDRI